MKKVAIYSPSASEPLGHPVYAQQVCAILGETYDIVLYTEVQPELNHELTSRGIKLQLTDHFPVGYALASTYARFGAFAKPIASFRFIYLSWVLLRDFYKRNSDREVFHLFEFEYISAFLLFFFQPALLKKSVLNFHASGFYWIKERSLLNNLYKGWLLPKAVRWMITHCKGVCVNSEYQRKDFIDSLDLHDVAEKVRLTGWGNENTVNTLSKQAACATLGIDPNKFYCLFFGVIRRSKGFEEVLSAFKDVHHDMHLLIAGSAWDYSEAEVAGLLAQAHLVGRTTSFVRYIEETEIALFYSASDIVLLPHKGEHQGFSGPLSLAVQFQRPVLASSVGQVGSFVEKYKLGRVFVCEDWADFVENLNTMKHEITDFNYPTSAFQQALHDNSWGRVVERIMPLYQDVLI